MSKDKKELKNFLVLPFNGGQLKIPKELINSNDFEAQLKALLIRNGINPTEEIIEELKKKVEEAVRASTPILTVEGKRAVYHLLSSESIKFHHTGWFLANGESMIFSQLFHAQAIVENEGEEDKKEIRTLPFIIQVRYNGNRISEVEVFPLHEIDSVNLSPLVGTIDKKTLGVSGLPTGMPPLVVKRISEEKPEANLEELREVFNNTKGKLLPHIEQNDTIVTVAVVWALGTFFAIIFGVYPILELLGVTGSGKTKFGIALTMVSKNGLIVANPTDANLPRIIDAWKPTILLDDWDEVMRRNREVVDSILKHVYKETVQVPRLYNYEGRFYLELFSPFCPAIITTTDPITKDQNLRRIIELPLIRSTKHFPNICGIDTYFLELFKPERTKMYELMFTLAPIVRKTFEEMNTNLPSPYDEIWGPILTIAKLLGEDIYETVYQFAKKSVEEQSENVYNFENNIIFGIEDLFSDENFKKSKSINGEEEIEFTISDLLEKLKAILVDLRKEISEEVFLKVYENRKVGKKLSTMGIRQVRRGQKGQRYRVITKSELEALKEKFQTTDVTDITDVSVGEPTSLTEGKKPENSNKNNTNEHEGMPPHARTNVSNVSDVSDKALQK